MPRGVYLRSEKHKKVLKGRKLSKEHIEKIRDAHIGVSIQHKVNCQCCCCKGRRGEYLGSNSPNFGLKQTKEHIEKVRNSRRGYRHSKETRALMSRAQNRPKTKAAKAARMMGDKNPMKRPEIAAKHAGENNPMKRPEVRAKISGKNSYLWKGGIGNLPYPIEFNEELKERIRERDTNTCQLCGKTQEEERKTLPVHHIDYVKENLDPNNLITLCNSCNPKVNFNREYWTEFFDVIKKKVVKCST